MTSPMTPQADDPTPMVSVAAYERLPMVLRTYHPSFLLQAAEIVLDRRDQFWKSAGPNGASDNTIMRLYLNDENCSQPAVWSAVSDILQEGAKLAGGKTVNSTINELGANFVVPSAAIRSARTLCEDMKKNFGTQEVIP